MGDTRFDDEGYNYGVRFTDGSVLHTWNGPTQRALVEMWADLWTEGYAERIEAVRRTREGDWETYR